MYKTNIVKRALYLWRGRETQSSLGPAAPWALCRSTVFLFLSLSLSLSLFIFRRPSRAYFLVKLYGACGWPLVQVRNERGWMRRGEEGPRGDRGARVLRRRPPDADWASRNFRACNYPWSSCSVVHFVFSLFLPLTRCLLFSKRDWFRAQAACPIILDNN